MLPCCRRSGRRSKPARLDIQVLECRNRQRTGRPPGLLSSFPKPTIARPAPGRARSRRSCTIRRNRSRWRLNNSPAAAGSAAAARLSKARTLPAFSLMLTSRPRSGSPHHHNCPSRGSVNKNTYRFSPVASCAGRCPSTWRSTSMLRLRSNSTTCSREPDRESDHVHGGLPVRRGAVRRRVPRGLHAPRRYDGDAAQSRPALADHYVVARVIRSLPSSVSC